MSAPHPLHSTISIGPLRAHFLQAGGQLELVESDVELLPGIRMRATPGHTPYHQSVLVESDGERALFVGDLIPTAHHLPLPWIMGYDVEPLVSLETKRALWAEAVAGDWLLVFEHDANVASGKLVKGEKGYALRQDFTL